MTTLYKICPGEDAPHITSITDNSGNVLDKRLLVAGNATDLEIKFTLKRRVAFTMLPDLYDIFDDAVIDGLGDVLARNGKLKRMTSVDGAYFMWIFVPKIAELFDLDAMKAKLFGFGTPSVLSWESIVFASTQLAEIVRNEKGGARLQGTFYGREFIERLVSISRKGFYLEEWASGNKRPIFLDAWLQPTSNPDKLRTMK